METEAIERTKTYWVKTFVAYCPLCGGGKTYRERQYTPKPENPADRIEFVEVWDYCGAL